MNCETFKSVIPTLIAYLFENILFNKENQLKVISKVLPSHSINVIIMHNHTFFFSFTSIRMLLNLFINDI